MNMMICTDTLRRPCPWDTGWYLVCPRSKKLNTKRSTDTEQIGADDALPHMLWIKYFIEAQIYGIGKNIMYQDNLIAMLLETNRKNQV